MRRRSDSHERKPAVSRGEASCRAGFRLKRGSRGKNTEQGFAAVIVFVPRERADFFDALRLPEEIRQPADYSFGSSYSMAINNFAALKNPST